MKRMPFVILLVVFTFCSTSTAIVIDIISGTDGNGNALDYMGEDPLTDYISASSPTKSPAIAWINRTDPINEPFDLLGSDVSRIISSAGVSDTWAEFYYDFTIPAEMSRPILSLQLSVDDEAKVYLNGTQLGGIYTHEFSAAVHTIIEDDDSLFNIGGNNVLKFHIINSNVLGPWTDTGNRRSGGYDWMAIEFEGTVQCLEGDVNCDGEVGLLDLDIIGRNWGQYNLSHNQGDLDGDGTVHLLDLDILGRHFGSSIITPEPATLGFFALGAIATMRRRRA